MRSKYSLVGRRVKYIRTHIGVSIEATVSNSVIESRNNAKMTVMEDGVVLVVQPGRDPLFVPFTNIHEGQLYSEEP